MPDIVLVWAWWTGISSLWFLLTDIWYTNIVGIDSAQGQITAALEKQGLKMYWNLGEYKVQAGDVVIYSDACPQAPEVLTARELFEQWVKWAQAPYSYFQFIGEISKHFEAIAIAGTHGKSTTTALATYTLSQCDDNFALGILWALVPQLNQKNYRANPNLTPDLKKIFAYILTWSQTWRDESLRKKYRFLIEADEFNRHFLYLDVDYAIVLNAELDHSDIYENEKVYLEAFTQFINKVKKNTYALDWEKWIEKLILSCPQLKIISKKQIYLDHLFGDHNQKNASLISTLLEDTLNNNQYSKAIQAMKWFAWLRRRMELLAILPSSAPLYSDYWHHPSEINAVYHAMRAKYTEKKLVAIFQPHQARRVLQFRWEFASTMQQFDEVIIYDIYAARENLTELLHEYPTPNKVIVSNINELGNLFSKDCNGSYITDFADVTNRIQNSKPDEVICIFTAGNLDFQIRQFLQK
jgi:UDP-N-acetylmuramate--alanine ligase